MPDDKTMPRTLRGLPRPAAVGLASAIIGWGLLLVGIIAGITLERWVL